MACEVITKAGQHKIVGEGLAVGLVALGVDAVTINERIVESAFGRAWQKWTCNPRFPQVRADVERNDIVGIVRGSARRLGPHMADWSCEGEYTPHLRIGSTLEVAGAMIGERLGITYDQWLELAAGFVEQLSEWEGEIRYRESSSGGRGNVTW
jgi:hypothetical protein